MKEREREKKEWFLPMPSLHTRWWLFDMQTPMEEKTSRRDFCLHNFKKTPTFSLHRVRRRKKQASTYFSRNFQERSHTEKKEEWRMIWSRFSSFSSRRKTLHRERKRKRERDWAFTQNTQARKKRDPRTHKHVKRASNPVFYLRPCDQQRTPTLYIFLPSLSLTRSP